MPVNQAVGIALNIDPIRRPCIKAQIHYNWDVTRQIGLFTLPVHGNIAMSGNDTGFGSDYKFFQI